MFQEKTEIGYFNPVNEGFKSLFLLLNIKHMYLQKTMDVSGGLK